MPIMTLVSMNQVCRSAWHCSAQTGFPLPCAAGAIPNRNAAGELTKLDIGGFGNKVAVAWTMRVEPQADCASLRTKALDKVVE